MELFTMNGLGDIYAGYEQYVRKTEMDGKKPVSLLKYALGKF